MFDLFREIAQTLSHNKLRTALTGLAVAWGIFMLIVLLGMSRGVLNGFTAHMSADRFSALSVWPGYTEKPFKGYKEGRRIKLKADDITRLELGDNPYISSVTSYKTVDSSKISSATDYITESVYGHFPSELKKAQLKMKYGRFLNQRDLDEKRKVVVLNEQNAKVLFDSDSAALGKQVKMMGLSWQVIGIYTHDWNQSSYVPFTTAMMLSGGDEAAVSGLTVNLQHVKTEDDGIKAEDAVRATLASQHDFAPDDTSGVFIWNRFVNYLKSVQAMDILSLTVWLIGILTMLSGIVGVSNIMFVSVKERTHEIGIRRAIGAKPRSILMQIVAESVAITTLFGYIGVVLGTIVTIIMAKLTEGSDILENPTVDLSIAIKVTIVLIVAGALAGLFPAIKATKVKPVEALRDE